MPQKAEVPPSRCFLNIFPVDYRFMGSLTSDPMGYADVNSGSNAVTSLSALVNGGSGGKVFERVENGVPNTDQVNEDSPYSVNGMLVEDRPPVGGEELDSAAAPLPSVSRSNLERRWSDLTSFATTKVTSGFWFDVMLSLLVLTGTTLCQDLSCILLPSNE
ncbi:hypothetical protein HRI_001933000 [Hibiscus trionum]|uniref:Uncharacterized protein n=1 Tax=Hibiscus trionum TaxID=183268 RepID=A0A9W7LYI5_HIBTR|nr:hypothetical protein HRI_001933000 [Hibiscus trionum]